MEAYIVQNSSQQRQYIESEELTDEERLQEDYWCLSELDLYKNEKEEPRKVIRERTSDYFDFTIVKNKKIREECKSYYRYLLLNYILSTKSLRLRHGMVVHIMKFVDEQNFTNTIAEISYEEFREKFIKYCSEDHQINTVVHMHRIDGNLSEIVYDEDVHIVNEAKRFYRYIKLQQGSTQPEMTKDVWDITKLPIPVELFKSRKRTTISFEHIAQSQIRETAKKYIYERLKLRRLSCVFDDMKTINLFSKFLTEKHPQIKSLNQLSMNVIKDYHIYLNNLDFVQTTKRARRGQFDTFIKMCRLFEIGDLPEQRIFPEETRFKKNPGKIMIIPKRVIDEIHEHMSELITPVYGITLVLEYIGMRVNEATQLSIDCLKKDSLGEYFLEYYQSKNYRINRVPISKQLANKLLTIKKYTLDNFPNSKYLFTANGRTPYPQESWSFHINKMAYKHNIVDDTGRPFRIKAHFFRHLVATRYAVAGMSPNMIRMMLGHSDMRTVERYIETRDLLAEDKLKNFFAEEDQRFEELKRTNNRKTNIPLAYGYCNSNDICDTALACYSCGMFKLDDVDKETCEVYLKNIRKRKEGMILEGKERQVEIFSKIEDIIRKALDKQNGSKQNG